MQKYVFFVTAKTAKEHIQAAIGQVGSIHFENPGSIAPGAKGRVEFSADSDGTYDRLVKALGRRVTRS